MSLCFQRIISDKTLTVIVFGYVMNSITSSISRVMFHLKSQVECTVKGELFSRKKVLVNQPSRSKFMQQKVGMSNTGQYFILGRIYLHYGNFPLLL